MICAFWRTDATMAPAGIQTTISGTPSNCPVSTWTVLSPASIAFGNAFSGLCISNILFVYFIGILWGFGTRISTALRTAVQRGQVIFKWMNKVANILVRQNRMPVHVTHYVATQLAYGTGPELWQSRSMLHHTALRLKYSKNITVRDGHGVTHTHTQQKWPF